MRKFSQMNDAELLAYDIARESIYDEAEERAEAAAAEEAVDEPEDSEG